MLKLTFTRTPHGDYAFGRWRLMRIKNVMGPGHYWTIADDRREPLPNGLAGSYLTLERAKDAVTAHVLYPHKAAAPAPVSGVAEGLAVKARAEIDGAGWRTRHTDPDVMPSAQVIRNHFAMSWEQRQLGAAPDKSVVWTIYRDVFMAACAVETIDPADKCTCGDSRRQHYGGNNGACRKCGAAGCPKGFTLAEKGL